MVVQNQETFTQHNERKGDRSCRSSLIDQRLSSLVLSKDGFIEFVKWCQFLLLDKIELQGIKFSELMAKIDVSNLVDKQEKVAITRVHVSYAHIPSSVCTERLRSIMQIVTFYTQRTYMIEMVAV